ncbi:PH domain-containing protein [Myceligenerans crystallogenes]|uniref:YdbS-like PH domain-containing protein n=1 Tax=Myceligenerans crystallogenes TaxID=316335 RepID=A0ABN2NM33_9MICO
MSGTEDFLRRHRGLRKYVLSGEEIVFATHRHWILLWEPALTTVGSFALLVAIFLGASSGMRDVLVWLFWAWALVALRFVWKYVEWRQDWLLMTKLRLMSVTGFLVQTVATMPRDKVTDIGYRQNLLGQLLNYGTFHFESAGQEQELNTVDYVPSSATLYRALMEDLFHPTPEKEPRPVAMPPSIMPPRQEEADDDAGIPSTPRTQRIKVRPVDPAG